MSTYTDLHNRVKENLAVDYNTRITTQKISAMNEENLFVGTFHGKFSGGATSQMSCIDCTILSGSAERQTLIEPLLSVGFNQTTQEPIISSLTAYIADHGGKGVTDPLYINDISVGNSLSCKFDSLYDTATHKLSDLLRDLTDQDTVLNICIRINEIKRLASLTDVPEIDYTTDRVQDLFAAVEKIAPSRHVTTFQQVVTSLNMALDEKSVSGTGAALSTRLQALSEDISIITIRVNSLSARFSTDIQYLSSQISDHIPFATMPAFSVPKQQNIAAVVYNALSAIPNERQGILDQASISQALYDLKHAIQNII